ncbi:uncharacterized protein SETTUDRAFT_135144 [Exserohilum turcica Et28A]|uniref:Uncharacterized protein n=1 Tax=Exserohilum turcicum (strain 28A) TaxID=671987 RepID=R0IQ04_EXST2|nr:uncharacterized protein SETTUDRAFT_135144 [Exserohilum turcica Et28A]EOA86801.1 hypothetical protein SETTUDRAFT_135144 [Exserohilum turcica Et28A]
MSLDDVRERIVSHGAGPQLDALPPAGSMTWVPYSVGNPTFGLAIAHPEGRQILAYLTRYGDKPREVRYCTKNFDRHGNKSTLIMTITQDEVMKEDLDPPFKYFAFNTKLMKRKFSMLIRWYFLSHGLIDTIEGGDMDDFCKVFASAIRSIENEKRRETLEESPEPEDADSTCDVHEDKRDHTSNVLTSAGTEPQSPLLRSSVPRGGKDNPDLRRILEYLKYHNALYLLDNLPEAHEMQFVSQTSQPDGQPKKLFVGSEAKSGHDIYAYMVALARGFHEVRFYVENPNEEEEEHMKSEIVAKQRILHPFSKCYPKPPGIVEQSDRARLTLMVKFYFIAAGIATDCVLRETKKYPERLRVALDYIADRMGPAAVKPPSSHTAMTDTTIPSEPPARHRLSSESSYIDESDIQSTLACEPPRAFPIHTSIGSSSAQKPPMSSSHLPSLPTSSPRPAHTSIPPPDPAPSTDADIITTTTTTNPASHGIKRSTEDAEFEDLARMVMKEQTLTKEINALQHDLDVLEEHKRAWLEKWAKEFDALTAKKNAVVDERSQVRKLFKRQRLSSTDTE